MLVVAGVMTSSMPSAKRNLLDVIRGDRVMVMQAILKSRMHFRCVGQHHHHHPKVKQDLQNGKK